MSCWMKRVITRYPPHQLVRNKMQLLTAKTWTQVRLYPCRSQDKWPGYGASKSDTVHYNAATFTFVSFAGPYTIADTVTNFV